MTSHGTTMLPSDLDIFLPSGSAMWPRHEHVLVRATGRTAASRSRAASRTSRASGRSPRRCSRPGSCASNLSWFSNGAWCWANGIEPGVEPDVDHLGHAAQRLAAGRRRDLDVVHERAVRVVELDAAELLELGEASRCTASRPPRCARPAAACPSSARATAPSRRCSPASAQAAVLDVLRVPVDGLVGGQQPVAQRRRADVPGRLGVVEQRRAAAPAVRVARAVGARRAAADRALRRSSIRSGSASLTQRPAYGPMRSS